MLIVGGYCRLYLRMVLVGGEVKLDPRQKLVVRSWVLT